MTRVSRMTAILLTLALATILVACSPSEVTAPAPAPTPGATEGQAPGEAADPAQALVDSKCSMCHTTQRVYDASYDSAGWADVIDRMKRNGLVISDEERATVIEFLSKE